jgi:hypothetical protein
MQNIVMSPEQLAEKVAAIRSYRMNSAPFAIAVDGCTQPEGGALVREYGEAGATWWFEAIFGTRGSHAEMLQRIEAGPPH